jgi:hypothetical protein
VNENQKEPPSCDQIVFLVGRNSRGQWVAQDRAGLYGGLFISRAAAVSYAMFENGHNPAAVIPAPEGLELKVGEQRPLASEQIGHMEATQRAA